MRKRTKIFVPSLLTQNKEENFTETAHGTKTLQNLRWGFIAFGTGMPVLVFLQLFIDQTRSQDHEDKFLLE